MRRILVTILLALLLVACATPAYQAGQPAPTAEMPGMAPPATEPTPALEIPSSTSSGVLSDQQMVEIPAEIEQMHPAEVDNSILPITPVEELHRTGRTQEYDIDTYHLVVDGLVDNPLTLSYEDLLSGPQVTETVLLICPGFFWDNAEWTGTPLRLILEEAGLSPDASAVRLVAGDGYSQRLSLGEAMADGVFLAYEVNGETLPPDHGYPIRLVARHQFGFKWVKWVEHIEVMA